MKNTLATFLAAGALASALSATTPASAGTYKHITIDGNFDDWIGVPVAHEDPADSAKSADYRKIWIANDDDYLYLRFSLESAANPFTSHENIFIDADGDSATGFHLLVGSEMLIQGGAAYQEKNGGFNEGGILGLDWLAAPATEARQFEVRISRKATYDTDKAPVFAGGSIAVLLEAEDGNFARQETAPDAEGLPYEFAPPPPAFTGSATLVPLAATWRHQAAGADSGTAWTAPDYDDTTAGWAAGTALLGYTATPGAYPAAIATPLATAATTHDLRTKFTWNANPEGVVFVATNYLSDGAVFYLNGAEIHRVRLPAGDLVSTTPATGGPAAAGQAEVFAVPAGPLVQGENVLAVALHQAAATPADLVFGLSLFAAASFPAMLPDAGQPADRSVVAGQPTTFAADVIGSAPLAYTWLKDGQPIPGATNATLVLDPVLPGDAGNYAVKVSNPANPGGATSRTSLLTVLSTPVLITEPPASLSVIEGQPARFTVSVTGSAPIRYQWLRGTSPIDGATNATLELPDVTQADAGAYAVEVSNPATPGLRSTAANLVVDRDTTAPALSSLQGSPNRIVLAFSERLDPASAQNPANYSAGGGLTIKTATLAADDPQSVVLTTSAQTLGTVYDLTVGQVKDRFGNALAAVHRRFLSTIQIDGSFDDWAGLEPAVDDPADAENATDYGKVWITSDSDAIYLRVQLHQASDLGIFYNNLFLNADGDASTGFGFHGVGSEVLIQGGGGYQQKGGGFNEGGIVGLDWVMVPAGVGSDFEIRFSRHATYATDGLPVFTADSVSLYLESENTSFQTVDVTPDAEPIVHKLINTATPELAALSAGRSGGKVRLSWTGPGRLQSSPRATGGTWQDVAGASSPYEVTADGSERYFRLAQ